MKSSLFHRFLAVFLGLILLLSCLPMTVPARELPPFDIDPRLLAWLLEECFPEGWFPKDFQFLPEETVPEPLLQDITEENEPEVPDGLGLYFGQLHAHTDISGGVGSLEEAYQYASQTEGLDFFAVTDHSDSFDNDLSGQLDTDGAAVSRDWAAGKAAAAAVTGSDFVGIFGYEMSWPWLYQHGHIGTFATPGFQSWQQEGYDTYEGSLERYYAALATTPGAIGQFNHPGTEYSSFHEFDHYSPDADRVMHLLEVGSGDQDGYSYYIKALDLGWHVAPTNNQASHVGDWVSTGARTAVWAKTLTEEGIYDAIRQHRVYATEDADLEILYTMNGYFMGAQTEPADIGERAEISVSLKDPTDSAIGTVEVVTTGGSSLTSQYLAESGGTMTFSLPPEPGYYFLRITQPDGDTAVTAPIWIEDGIREFAITSFVCETALPVQNEPVTVSMEFLNEEKTDFQIKALEILADGRPVASDTSLTRVPAQSTLAHDLTFFCDSVGMTEITLRVNGTLGEVTRTLEASMMLSFQQSQLISAIAVDGGHGNQGLDSLTLLTQQAMAENIDLTVLTGEPTAAQLERFRFLLISAPTEPFSEDFLNTLSEYAAYGGSIVVCGQGYDPDSTFQSIPELNRLLAHLGSEMRLQEDLVLDDVNNGGSPEQIYTDNIDFSSDWCSGISQNQVYRHISGCSVEGGTWLVKGRATTYTSVDQTSAPTLLAAEALSGGGTLFAAGTLFCEDGSMEQPQNIWDEPYANYTLAHTLLSIGGDVVPLSTIQQARDGGENELFRVRGYVTAGTSNPYNTFPNTLYLQDDTGGIMVLPFTGESLQQGIALEVTGYATEHNGNRCLKPSRWEQLDADGYLYEPLEEDWSYLLDADLFGGALVQVEGTCLEVYAREDGTLAGCLLQDGSSRLAKVKIEDYIGNGSDGGNDLHKTIRRGRTVRAMGILHIDEFGDTVIRVRNCEEVVWVPPLRLLNPATGDSISLPVIPMALSFLGLVVLKRRSYRGRYLKKR